MGFFRVLRAELTRMFIIMRRYWFATIIGIIIGYGMLITIIFAFMTNRDRVAEAAGVWADQAVNGSLGFVAGMFAFGLTGLFTQGLQGMMRTGELEQLCMSPYGLVTNFLARSFVMAVNSVLSLSIMVWLVAYTVDGKLHFFPAMTALLFFLTYVNLIGFGFLVGGLVLVFKQTGQIAMLLRIAMIGIATFATTGNINEWPTAPRLLVHALPITDAAICLKYTLVEGQQQIVLDAEGEPIVIDQTPVIDSEGEPVLTPAGEPAVKSIYAKEFLSVVRTENFFWLIINCTVWMVIGIALFRRMEDWSRDKGTLGAY